jgi:hypothetical protein
MNCMEMTKKDFVTWKSSEDKLTYSLLKADIVHIILLNFDPVKSKKEEHS